MATAVILSKWPKWPAQREFSEPDAMSFSCKVLWILTMQGSCCSVPGNDLELDCLKNPLQDIKLVKYNLRHGFGCSRRGETFAVSARLVLVESGAKHGTLQLYNGGHDDPSNSEARWSKVCGEHEVLKPSKPSRGSSHWTWLASTEVQEAVRNFAKKLLWRIAANGRPCAEWQSPWSCCEWPVRSVPYGRHDLDQVINIRVQDGSLIFDMILLCLISSIIISSYRSKGSNLSAPHPGRSSRLIEMKPCVFQRLAKCFSCTLWLKALGL